MKNYYNKFEVKCLIKNSIYTEKEIIEYIEKELLKIYKNKIKSIKDDLYLVEVLSEKDESIIIYFYTHSIAKARYYGYNGNMYRFKSGIAIENIIGHFSNKELNIVKKTAKELGMTQKELAKRIKTSEVSLSRWAKGEVQIPKWALEMFELLKTEKKYNEAKSKFKELDNIFK